ncbi:WRKY DNA-binding transcription factor 70-like [Punica granatum]|uniref:WRKY domain-containing protein n=2 Tax=Punica granatum TaxID=22663 RepID=A0A218WB47_PUNGR|nr:WRKY DNA-binding transcription factor 70-like [Punica granatum]OWM69866.1 hypothetical protein CDL15_Pgr025715 [Punica granatum]PKI64894.1 hypothetical protein CRG98_014690 [Punica granatum]
MAALIWPERLPQRVISELVNGREMAVQLQVLLRKDSRNHGSASAQEIAGKIMRSFTESIHLLSSVESGEVCDDGGSEDSDASKKRSELSGSKDGRGCYKRRKGSQTRTEISATTGDDYAWRKYGQKDILNAKFPRCYFRCTHKPDQGCRATKQVQRMEDNQQMYQITYIGVHTCRKTSRLSPQIITDTDPWELSDCSKNQAENNKYRVPATVKHEYYKEEDNPSDVTENSFTPLGLKFEREPMAGPDHDFGSLDVDELMASCVGLDASDFSFADWNCL